MNTISSGHVFSPAQPPPDIGDLSGKDAGQSAFQPTADVSSQAINFGQNGASGTDFSSLMDNNLDSMQQNLSSMLSQTLSELINQLMQSLLPMLQQMMNNSQGDDNGAVSGGNPTASSGETPPEMQATVQPEANAATGGASASPQLASGASGLHLPEALKPYEADIQNAADKTGVPAQVLAAQIWQESRGNLGATTTNGGNGLQDSGLMQVNSNTFADLQSKNPELPGANANANNPADNIMAGALYMKEQSAAFGGDIGAALRAYNSGPNNVNVNDLSDISKTGTGDATYVSKVMDFANIIGSGNGTLPA
ncbi:transglycosylase SLT domain-containing protein [Winslowiella iniecta]|uniref:Transglycosylase SLT domain-containing protein n=1 Tax=Winslowiella iniecta TaxID=1560201 RepID=A0A0L7SYI9_9GAMM|nr:transglycosylase SLT domain-containing protein [Winslowiella iniecta]KOC88021.1 hypothetical protein NG43_20875 [Winslowiella iniecta]KOC91383.1 hypothetical protein NG42_05980 [Winslowiella iniecta]